MPEVISASVANANAENVLPCGCSVKDGKWLRTTDRPTEMAFDCLVIFYRCETCGKPISQVFYTSHYVVD